MLKVIKSMAVSLLVAPSAAQWNNVNFEKFGSMETLNVKTDPVPLPVLDAAWSTSASKISPDTIATGIDKAKNKAKKTFGTSSTLGTAAPETIVTGIDKAKKTFGTSSTLGTAAPETIVTGIDKATTSIDRASPKISSNPAQEPKRCCRAMKAKCLACQQGISVEEFCSIKSNLRYCRKGKAGKRNRDEGSRSQASNNTTATGTGTRCISDEDCLQLPGARQCPLFCVEGRCAAWKEDYPPVLHLRSGIPVKTGNFVLREDPELSEIFENAVQWVPKEMLQGRFLERVEGSNELLEVKYPKGFFEIAAQHLESVRGEVPASEISSNAAEFEQFDSIDTDEPRIDVPGVNPGTVAWGDMDFGRRLTAIQDESPDRWHSGVMNTQFPWRMTGRLSMGCTAALIGNRVLVTAAHCVWDKDTNSWGDFPTFAAGQDGNDQPFGTARVTRMTIPSCYQTCNTNNECRGCDWAVLVLRGADRLNVGYFGFSTNKAGRLNLAGYPQSKNREQWYDHCPLHSDEGNWIKHRCDTEPGNSGSGIYTIRNGNRYIVSIHGGGYTDQWNRGADIAGRTSSAGRVYDRMLAERRIYG